MPNLSEIFALNTIEKDDFFEMTHYADSCHSKSVCFVLNDYYLRIANKNPNITAIITTHRLAHEVSDLKGLLIDENPKKMFFKIHNELANIYPKYLPIEDFIDPSAYIAPSVRVGKNVYIGKDVVIENGAIINSYSHIGDSVYIGENVVIGARGMHNTKVDGRFVAVKDMGGVWIEDQCEVLAGAVIQKSYFREFTRICRGSRIGPLCNIGHGVNIGINCLIAGHSVIAGFCNIGNNVWVGPSVCVSHGVRIGDGASVKLGSVVIANIFEGQVVSGNFALEHSKQLRNFYKIKKNK